MTDSNMVCKVGDAVWCTISSVGTRPEDTPGAWRRLAGNVLNPAN
jgi:hypothetical protein